MKNYRKEMAKQRDNTQLASQHESEMAERLLSGIRQIIDTTRRQAMAYVNQQISLQYYSVGRYIADNLHAETYDNYGKAILATVSQTLQQEYGKGYSYSALTRMRRVALCYPAEMFATLSQTLTWSHFQELVAIEDCTKRLFYEKVASSKNWGIRTLRGNISKMYYERTLIAAQPEDESIETQTNERIVTCPEVQLKSLYVLDFLGLTGYYSEEELEDAILANLERFLLELGEGFTFEARQKRVSHQPARQAMVY